jgi:hypothetical protein
MATKPASRSKTDADQPPKAPSPISAAATLAAKHLVGLNETPRFDRPVDEERVRRILNKDFGVP